MAFWPFKRKQSEPPSPEGIREQLIQAAASGSRKRLLKVCLQYRKQVAANVDLLSRAPVGMQTDPASLERYIQCLGTVAQCLANECGAPELWNKLCGTPEDNPLLQWDQWYEELPERTNRLEHDALIAEAHGFIARVKTLQGHGARQHEVILNGRLGELLFHSGRVDEAEQHFQTALNLCREMGDREGEQVYLANLLETYRYLGNTPAAINACKEHISLLERQGLNADGQVSRLKLLSRGEPLCRITCERDGKEFELDELPEPCEGHYQFLFRRNRLQLQTAVVHTQKGKELAEAGNLADALERFLQATEIDPHDPDPVYQSGVCLLEMGAYAKAREQFEHVEKLAPAWFHCRSDRWLAQSLEEGSVSDEEFRIVRVLADGGLPDDEALAIAQEAVCRHPDFAPLYLILGDLYRNLKENEQAIASYRQGLERVTEPDLESRLLCALAGILPKDSSDRTELVERALSLQGNLVAQATAAILRLP
jgi:tetratricopeptide (TPR) repeat protein